MWAVDPLLCPRCGAEMAKLAVIKDPVVLTKILTFETLVRIPLRQRDPPPGGAIYEPCSDDLPAAAEPNDPSSFSEVQVFPDYDSYDLGPVYD
jgi:hypothetical protein